jgi:hypothetical protein
MTVDEHVEPTQGVDAEAVAQVRDVVGRMTRDGVVLTRRHRAGEDAFGAVDRDLVASFGGLGVPVDDGGDGGGPGLVAATVRTAGRSLWPGRFTSHLGAVQLAAGVGIDVAEALAGRRPWSLGYRRAGRLASPHATAGGVVVVDDGRRVEVVTVRAVADAGGTDPSHAPLTVEVDEVVAAADDPDARASGVARALVAAELLGVAEGARDLAVEHARGREQFGRPIGSFQAVAHQLADAFVRTAEADALLRRVLTDAAEGDATAASLAPAACTLAADAAVHTCERTVQVLGGVGMTADHDAHLFLRRALVLSRALLRDRPLAEEAGRAYLAA